jgi:hypothetical protein
MKHPAPLLIALAALACCPVALAQAPPAAQESIVARDLKKLRLPGKVSAVLWTRRGDRLTLQVMPLSTSGAIRLVAKPGPDAKPFPERLQIWLLRADGTMITPVGIATPRSSNARESPVIEVLYSYPLSAGKEAVAVAMKFDDQFLIEELVPFE